MKYGLAPVACGVTEVHHDTCNALDFEWEKGRWQHTDQEARRSNTGNPRFRVDVALNGAKPYLGFRVIVPFGN